MTASSLSFLSSILSTLILPSIFLAITAFLVAFVLLPYIKVNSYKKCGASTYFFPFLGFVNQMQQALNKKGDHMAEYKEASKNYPNSKFLATHMKRTPFFFLQDPKYIKEFLQNQHNYKKIHVIDVLRPLLGNGLMSSEGETWKRHRKIVSASFNFEFLKANMPLIQSTVRECFTKLSPEGYRNYSAIRRMQDITGEIAGRIFFGETLNSYIFEGKPLTSALAQLFGDLGSFSMDPLVVIFGPEIMKIPLFPKYKNILKRVDNFRRLCLTIIQNRKSKPQSDTRDLLSSLLAIQQSEDIENRFTEQDIVDEFVTFFMAGMDTTGHLLGMTFYNLTQYPEYLPLLKTERQATYNKESLITTDTLAKMDVLHSFLKETLRFYSPTPVIFLREALKDHDILDLKLKKGDIVTPSFITPAFDEKNFENAYQFNPARWKNIEGKLDPYAFTPFSAGPRSCIGQHLAIINAKIIVSEFLERFDFELKEGYQLKMMFRFLYEPQDELLLNLRPKVA